MDGTVAEEWTEERRARAAQRCGALAILAWHAQQRVLASLLIQAQDTLVTEGPIPVPLEGVEAELDDVRARWVAMFTSEPWLQS